MYLRRCYRRKNGRRHAYWALVESYRTERGPRQRVVAYLGELDEAGRLGVQQAAVGEGQGHQPGLFEEGAGPTWVDVDLAGVRVERTRLFGGPWLGLTLLHRLGLPAVLEQAMGEGRETIRWSVMALVLVLARLCEPSSELQVAERWYEGSALEDLLGVSAEHVNDDRLYRALDVLVGQKERLERHLKERVGELFGLTYDLLLYDVTSTYFEGEAAENGQARRGYSRDHRADCKQVCLALVVSREGFPLGYEVFAGNRTDVTTVETVVETMEARYGRADRIWVLDRGMVSAENLAFLRGGGRRYIVGTLKGMLKQFERAIVEGPWETIREGLEVQRCAAPEGTETFILCRSAQRRAKDAGMHERFVRRIADGLARMEADCAARRRTVGVMERRVGRLLGANSRAAGLFAVQVEADERGAARVRWSQVETWRRWSEVSEGCYLLRSNISDWSAADLWQAYMQLTEAEAAFRVQKSDLRLRPIWHQKAKRVQAHILVCFLAYVVWKTLGQLCERAGLGSEPRQVFAELQRLQMVDVVLPTRGGIDIRKRCVSQPTQHQAILLQRLGLTLPARIETYQL